MFAMPLINVLRHLVTRFVPKPWGFVIRVKLAFFSSERQCSGEATSSFNTGGYENERATANVTRVGGGQSRLSLIHI